MPRPPCTTATGPTCWLVPLAVVILLYRRRKLLADSLTGGSVWGLMLLLGGFAVLGASTWPFDYGYFRVVAVVPVLAGIVLTVGGWGVFKRCLPMLLLVFLSIPIGQRKYADLIITPETYTLAATHRALNALPGVVVDQDGVDLTFHRASGSGTIALGESPSRGVVVFGVYRDRRVRHLRTVEACLAGGGDGPGGRTDSAVLQPAAHSHLGADGHLRRQQRDQRCAARRSCCRVVAGGVRAVRCAGTRADETGDRTGRLRGRL